MKRWKFMAIATLLVAAPLSGCSNVPKLSDLTDGEMQDYFTPMAVDEGSTFDAHTNTFGAPNSFFEVKLPGPPRHDRHYEIRTSHTRAKVIYETPEVSYAVTVTPTEWMPSFPPSMAQQILKSNLRAVQADVGATNIDPTGEVGDKVALADGRFPGRQVAGRTRDDRFYRTSAYLDRNQKKVYRLIVVGSKDSIASAEVNEFFSSFKITK